MKEKTLNETMGLKITETEPCRMKAEVTIPAETVDNEIKNTLKLFAQQVNIPGFRQGKAPLQLVKKRYNDSVMQELTRNFHIVAADKIRAECKKELVTLPMPEGNLPQPDNGKEYSFSLIFDVLPDIKLPDYKGLKLKKEPLKVTDKEIEKEIDRYRDMYSEFGTIEEPAAEGDMLKISFTSDLEIAEDAPMSYKRLVNTEDSWCWLNEPEMLPGIVKALTGLKAGDTKKLKIEFPADFTEPLLAGKKGKYEITVKEVQRRIPLKDDEELCKRLSIENIDILKERIKTSIEARQEYEQRTKLQNEALETLASKVGKIDLPPALLGQATQAELRKILNDLVKSEDDVAAFRKDSEKHHKAAEEAARKRITNFIIARKIADAENIAVQQHEIDQRIASISMAYGYKEKDLRQQMESSGALEDLHMDMTIEKVANFLVDNAASDKKETSEKAKDKTKKKEAKKEDKPEK